MPIRAIIVAALLLMLAPAAAHASVADEQRQGQQLVTELRSGAKSCSDLTSADFDHIGEYVMGRAVGSTSVHETLNERMVRMMGATAESRMHQLMGAHAVGCTTSRVAGSAMGGPAMMTGGGMMGTGGVGFGALMASGGYRWMIGGNWQHMSRQDWQHLQHQWFGTSTTPGRHDGGDMGWIIAAVLAAVLVGVGVAFARRRSSGRPPAAASSA